MAQNPELETLIEAVDQKPDFYRGFVVSEAGRFGARRVFIPDAAMFARASIGCALAENITILNTFRLTQGTEAAMLLSSSLRIASQYRNDAHSRRAAVSV